MATASWLFLLFSAVVAAAWHLWSNKYWRQLVLLAANLVFLSTMSMDPWAYIPFVIFLAGSFCAVKISGRSRSGGTVAVLVTVITVAFCWMKKYWFLSGLGFLDRPYLTIGLSYIFFRVLHLVIDAKDEPSFASIGPLTFANYTLNFTSLVAGPIQRYGDYREPAPPLDLPTIGRAVERIIIGFFKILVVARIFLSIHDSANWALPIHDGFEAHVRLGLLSVAAYPIYLYFNFSGYMDIVIGVARFLDLELPENFNRPFAALNFMDFWARYHMTLSNWLRDYVYTPFLKVLMNRFQQPALDPLLGTLAFFVTFFLIGIWHGPTVIFAVYGLLLAFGISCNKLYQTLLVKRWGRKTYRDFAARPVYQACCRGLTFTWYAISMVCFWATGDEALNLVRMLGPVGISSCAVGLFVAATPILALIEHARSRVLSVGSTEAPLILSRYTRTVWAVVMLFLSVSVAFLAENAASDIVYKAF